MASTRSKLTGSLYITDDLEIVGSITASQGFQGLTDVFSASAQVDHDSTTNFVAAEHISHTGVAITGTGLLTGGGNIDTSRAITIDTSTADWTTAIVNQLPTGLVSSSTQMDTLFNLDGVVSSSAQINALDITEVGTISSGVWSGTALVAGKVPAITALTGYTAGAYANASSVGGSSIATVGTIGTGAWQGTIIASAYLDSDTAHLTTAQTFTGEKKFATDVTVSGSLIISSSIGDSPYGMLVKGAISASGDVIAYQSSDRNLKDNIVPIESPLEKLSQINGVAFDWNNKQDLYTGRDIGVIAQEIEKVLPEIVQTRESGYKAVRYDKIVALLIEAIKEQQLQIDELKTRL